MIRLPSNTFASRPDFALPKSTPNPLKNGLILQHVRAKRATFIFGIQINGLRNLTTSLCPNLQVNINAVHPSLSLAFKSMFYFKRSKTSLTMSLCPFLQVKHYSSLSIIVSGIKINVWTKTLLASLAIFVRNETFLDEFKTLCVTMIIRETSPTFFL